MRSAEPSKAINGLVDLIDAALPQTQCTRCGYPACRPYAEAVAVQEISINRCEPGGLDVIRALATITGTPLLDRYHPPEPALLAVIREEDCIGCARCLPACPVDAIVGSRKWLHQIVSDQCTGCQLCIAPCPVDCIDLIERSKDRPLPLPEDNLVRHQRRLKRREARAVDHQRSLDRATRRKAMIERARLARQARIHTPS